MKRFILTTIGLSLLMGLFITGFTFANLQPVSVKAENIQNSNSSTSKPERKRKHHRRHHRRYRRHIKYGNRPN